ncbi:hypothetical protein ACFE04_022349 [Oxalis oulophora]
MMPFKEEKEEKKENFRKYLDSSGILDALTKVLVALYEQNEKTSSALEFVQQKLGGPSLSDYEKVQNELSDLQRRYNELLATHRETFKETDLEEAKVQEATKFQSQLQELQTKIDETNAALVKERATVKKVIEEAPPVIKETQVIVEVTAKVEALTSDMESFKALLESEKQKAEEFEGKYKEAQEQIEEKGKKLEESEKKVQLLAESVKG